MSFDRFGEDGALDLEKLARTKPRKAKLDPKQRIPCLRCGDVTSRGNMRAHQKHACCRAKHAARTLYEAELYIVNSSALLKACVFAGVQVLAAPSSYGKKSTLMQHWGPLWLSLFNSWEMLAGMGDTDLQSQVVPVLREAADSPAAQEALLAVHALSGHAGIKALVETPKWRADKLRTKARQLLSEAATAFAEADGLDPAGSVPGRLTYVDTSKGEGT